MTVSGAILATAGLLMVLGLAGWVIWRLLIVAAFYVWWVKVVRL